MSCPVGRTYDPGHVTCRNCPVDCRRPRKIRQAVNSGPAGKGWMTTLDLTSPNAWANKQDGRRVYRDVKRQWQKALSGAAYHLGLARGLREVEIVRYVGSRGYFFDPDNLVAACKPLLDCLTAAGILIDDDHDHIRLRVRQEFGAARVEIDIREES